jgi:putative nucleotidyltransferase with HDIG domain
VLVLSMLVRIDTPFGFTVPTQLAYVPLVFVVPPALVPLVVAAAFLVAGLRGVRAGEVRLGRMLATSPPNAWFAVGPSLVFALARTDPTHSGAGLLLVALAAQFSFDFAVSFVRFSIGRSAALATHLRETWVYAIDAALSGIGLQFSVDIHERPVAVIALIPLLGLLAMFARERRQRLESVLELGNAYRGTAMVLGDVVEADDGYTGAHSRGVVELALKLGKELNLSSQRLHNLEFGALLHDVGKIAIPKEIINKPGKLDPHEWELIKTHTIEGQKMLDQVGGFMNEVGLIVRSHHERWDGKGYPDALAGEAIPLESRIIACCDSWNAMRTDRVYRKALSHEAAVTELIANSGTQFDPRVIAAMLAVVATASEADAPAPPLAQAA